MSHIKLPTLVVAFWALCSHAHAQVAADHLWPTRLITIIVPVTTGSASDVWSRLYTQSISENTDWKFLIDFKPGAGATLGAAFVAKAAPDGYTLLIASSSLTTAPIVYKNLTFDPVRSFAPVSLTSNGSSMLLVNPSLPVTTYKEYVAYARANPGKINFGNSGVGSTYHLSGVALHRSAGAEVTFIPYKGGGDVTNAILSGEINAMFGSLTAYLPLVKAGKLRALGVTTIKRSNMLPDLTTLQELCGCEFEHNAWTGIVAPAGTPAAVVNMLSREFIKAASRPNVAKRLAEAGQETGGSTPEIFAKMIAYETDKWRRLVKEANLTIRPE